MKKVMLKYSLLLLSVVILSSCEKESEGMDEMKDKAKVIFINAAPPTNALPIAIFPYYNGKLYNPNPLRFPSSLGYKAVDPGSFTMKLDSANSTAQPAGAQATLKTVTVNVEADSYYSMFATGTVSNAARFDVLFIKDDLAVPSKGKAKIRFINIVTDSAVIDIVNAATGAAFPSATGLAYRAHTNFIEIDPADFANIRIRDNVSGTYISPANRRVYIEPGSVYTLWATGFKTPPPGAQAAQLWYVANRYTINY